MCTLNIRELDDMSAMAKAWGVPYSFDLSQSKRRDGRRFVVPSIRLSAEKCVDLEEMDLVSISDCCSVENSTQGVGEDGAYCYSASKNSFVIGPSGAMRACNDLPFPAARPLSMGFAEGWHEVQEFVVSTPEPSVIPMVRSVL